MNANDFFDAISERPESGDTFDLHAASADLRCTTRRRGRSKASPAVRWTITAIMALLCGSATIGGWVWFLSQF